MCMNTRVTRCERLVLGKMKMTLKENEPVVSLEVSNVCYRKNSVAGSGHKCGRKSEFGKKERNGFHYFRV